MKAERKLLKYNDVAQNKAIFWDPEERPGMRKRFKGAFQEVLKRTGYQSIGYHNEVRL